MDRSILRAGSDGVPDNGNNENSVSSDNGDNSEVQLRLKNMFWTVSGDYSLEQEMDTSLLHISEEAALYDAIKRGCFQKYFEPALLKQYLDTVFLMGAEPSVLLPIAALCVESAVWKKAVQDRAGVSEIREQALRDILEKDNRRLTHTDWGFLEACYLRFSLYGAVTDPEKQKYVTDICLLADTLSTAEVIGCIDRVYGRAYEKGFADKFKGYGSFYDTPGEEGKAGKEGDDGADEEEPEERIANLLTDSAEEDEAKKHADAAAPVVLADETMARSKSYIELNYGKSYLSGQEQKHLNAKLCAGVHKGRRLHFTDGLLADETAGETFQARYARQVREENRELLEANGLVARQNIVSLADTLRRALLTRDDKETFISDYGSICIPKLWNIGRTRNKKLFEKEFVQEHMDFVVEVLIDASGSQQIRQSKVALQSYMISSALTQAGLPHRVTGFCTFGEYTVMRRYRDYEEGPEGDERLLEFTGSANNRDGLAVRAAAHSLAGRREERKILIILSDGVPNDIITGKSKSRDFIPYCREYALKDTAREVYALRNKGIAVMGIFVGEEEALPAEKQIFGNEFAYIRDIADFSNVVGRYLRERIIG